MSRWMSTDAKQAVSNRNVEGALVSSSTHADDANHDRMMAKSMINQAHAQGGKVRSFVSNCGGGLVKKGNYKKSPNTKSSIIRISKEVLKEKGPTKPKAAPVKPKRVVKSKVALVKSNVGKKKRLDEDVEVEDERVSKVEDERGSLMV
ncbi:hypothetical protein Tco_0633338 [Tanacetum coccineum]